MTAAAVAGAVDEATIRARFDEAAAVYPLPAWSGLYTYPDRTVVLLPDAAESTRALFAKEPPFAVAFVASFGAVFAWAQQLGLSAPMAEVRSADDGSVWRRYVARGDWLGWRVCIQTHEERVAVATTPAIVRLASKGVLL